MEPHRPHGRSVITSTTNPNLKLMRSLGRRKVRQAEGAFLVEGKRLVEEASAGHDRVQMLLVREDIDPTWTATLKVASDRIRWVSHEVFNAASDVEHAQGVAAICQLPEARIDCNTLDEEPGTILILDRMRDPGNVGTALRTAAAAGVHIVFITAGTADPFSPKVVRAGMGAHFRLKIAELTIGITDGLREGGGEVVFADAKAAESLFDYSWRNTRALIVGGETEPLSPDLADTVTRRLSIPMCAGIESLNAGVAASIMLFEARRQTSKTDDIV